MPEFAEQTVLGKVLGVENIIIRADTMVEYDGKMYGKPKTQEEAVAVLTKVSSCGRPNIVCTAVVIKHGTEIVKFVESTKVYMIRPCKEEIFAYVDTLEPFGNAGRYAIQGLGGYFVEKIEGDYNNVTGFPLCSVRRELIKILSKIRLE